MPEETFRIVVEEAWSDVPDKFKGRIENVALLVEDEPDEETRKREGLSGHETLLGLYQGIPKSVRGEHYGIGATLPDTITLYRLPLLAEAQELMHEKGLPLEEAVRTAVRETLWHEVGHYFGLHEEEVQVRERRGTNRFKDA